MSDDRDFLRRWEDVSDKQLVHRIKYAKGVKPPLIEMYQRVLYLRHAPVYVAGIFRPNRPPPEGAPNDQ